MYEAESCLSPYDVDNFLHSAVDRGLGGCAVKFHQLGTESYWELIEVEGSPNI